jgi:cell division protein FtsB
MFIILAGDIINFIVKIYQLNLSILAMKYITSVLLTFLALIVVYFTVFGNYGLIHLKHLQSKLMILEAENQNLQTEISMLQDQIRQVQNNKSVLERKAREELGLSQPNEIIYLLPENSVNNM